MKDPIEYLDEMSDDSMSETMPLEEWLEWLMQLRDELDMRIASTRTDVENLSKKKKQ